MLEDLDDSQYEELLEYIALFSPLGPERGDWYVRSIVGVLTGQEVTKDTLPMPWEIKPKPKKQQLSESERKAKAQEFKAVLAAEVLRTGAGVS
jgi:hypothetical protein